MEGWGEKFLWRQKQKIRHAKSEVLARLGCKEFLMGAMGGISVILVKNHFFILLNKFNLHAIMYDSLKFQISITVVQSFSRTYANSVPIRYTEFPKITTTLSMLYWTANWSLFKKNPCPETQVLGAVGHRSLRTICSDSIWCPNTAGMQPFSHLRTLIEMCGITSTLRVSKWMDWWREPVPWTPWSPDLTPLNYFLCGVVWRVYCMVSL